MFVLRNKDNSAFIVKQQQFPDGTLLLDNGGFDSDSIRSIEWQYENDAEFFTLMCLRDVYNSPETELYIPYLPHARMDRVKKPSDTFTLKTFCKAINNMNFKVVRVWDVHSSVSLALLDRVINLPPTTLIYKAMKRASLESSYDIYDSDLILFYPDEGAMKRYTELIQHPYAFGIKNRDWSTGKIKDYSIVNKELVKDKVVLMVDDICSKGGTFKFASEALIKAGAKEVFAYATHLENSVCTGEMYNNNLVKKIFTSRSIAHKVIVDDPLDKIIEVSF